MKKLLAATLLTAGMACAQSGIAGGQDGLHQYNAYTLGQWHFALGTGGNVSIDNWSLAKGGIIKTASGKDFGVYEIDGSFTGNFNFAMGIFNWLDIGVNLPVYYDYVGSSSGLEDDYNMSTITRGDLEMWAKFALPFGEPSSVLSTAVLFQAYAAIGETSAGVRPRHAWYLAPQGYFTNPYTANGPAFALSAIATLDFTKRGIPLRWNTQLGFLYAVEDYYSNVFLYSTGLNWFLHKKVDLFLEFSGEMRVQDDNGYDINPLVDPMLLTPGVRFHLSRNLDLGMGLEVAVRTFKNLGYDFKDEMKDADDFVITYGDENGRVARYGYASTPLLAGAATLVYRFGGDDEDPVLQATQSFMVDSAAQARLDSLVAARAVRNDSLARVDSDKDGVVDLKDKCTNTPEGVSVDSTGCPLDADKDGVPDGLDKCPSTPAGAAVGEDGCESDFDKDGIVDGLDKCPNTAEGVTVDSTGCPIDSDKDGIPDGQDKCPNTAEGIAVDETGCPVDSDKDGVVDTNDKCPNTAAGVAVDEKGCPLDSDKDGVIDANDKCPNTAAGVTVDETGCPLDFDKDGVPDINDKCPNTAAGVTVGPDGCNMDSDKDGVPDGLDKCPTTAEGVTVDSLGCDLDFDKDGIPDVKDKCPNTLPGVKVDADGCPLNKKQDLDRMKKGIQFKNGSAKLTKKSFGTLNDIAKLMKEIPEANLEVQGHTDNTGSEDRNNKLSQDRAQSVVDYLVKKGVDSSRLRATGFGPSKPIADNKTKAGREKNRRVELVPFTK